MTGLELSQEFFAQRGRPALKTAFPKLFPRMAIGLAGEGSECFGFDDDLSRDHDWGAGFCIWLTAEDFDRYGAQVQARYDALPRDGFPERKNAGGSNRVGCLSIPNWYHRYTGSPTGPQTLDQWRIIPEHFLAAATNGAVFHDPSDEFSALRRRLLDFYPDDVRLKKMTARAAVMGQAGQYNYPRCLSRGERVAAQLALSEFIRAACSMGHLLNRRYTPFYKWMHRSLKDLPILPRLYGQLSRLVGEEPDGIKCRVIEEICTDVIAELRRQGLTDAASDFLPDHCGTLMAHIQDPGLRRTHILEE